MTARLALVAACLLATALAAGGVVLLDGESDDNDDVVSTRPTQTSPTTLPTPTLPPHEASARVERMLDSKHARLTDVAMMPTGRALTLWTGACQRRGHPCTQVYVLRDLDGTSATYALPEGKLEVYGAIPYEDGFVLPSSSAPGWIVHADGRLERYTKGLRRVAPVPSLVQPSSYSGVVVDLETGTTARLPRPPGHKTVSIMLAPGGDLWAVVRKGTRYGARISAVSSTDSGRTWDRHPISAQRFLTGRVLASGTHAAAIVSPIVFTGLPGWPQPQPTIGVTADGGTTWSRLRRFPFERYNSAVVTPDGDLLALSAKGQLWQAGPAWRSFTRVGTAPRLDTLRSSGPYLYGIENYTTPWFSDDGGATWRRLPGPG